MSAPVLTNIEQKASLSGKKKKKKFIKNILGIPNNLKIECCFIDKKGAAKLQEILKRLLPSARLPLQQNKSSTESAEQVVEDSQLREKAKTKRDQLSLGVNALNKSIKKNLVSAVLLADDIQPNFLTNHLNLLCDHYKIPFLYMSGLREITSSTLGFPCIAVGFKIDSCDFLEAVWEIKSLFESRKVISKHENQEAEVDSSESDECEISESKICIKSSETPFSYLYRTSIKERAFVPDRNDSNLSKKQATGDFISVEKESVEINSRKNDVHLGISMNLIRKQQSKAKKLLPFSKKTHDDEEIPRKKKRKKDGTIDNIGIKQNTKYSPAQLFRIPSNPNRNAKKK